MTLVAGVVTLGACSSLDGRQDTLDARWDCLEAPVAASGRRLPAASAEPPHVRLSFVDLFQRGPLADVEVRACLGFDYECANPITDGALTDAAGQVDLALYVGFNGYLELRRDDLISTLYFLPALEADVSLEEVGLVPAANLETFNTNFDAGIDFDRGHLVVTLHDCRGQPAQGVSLVTEAAGKPFFMIGGLPSFNATTSGPGGAGGLLNLSDPTVFIRGEVEDERGQHWAIGEGTYAVRPQWVTIVSLGPPVHR